MLPMPVISISISISMAIPDSTPTAIADDASSFHSPRMGCR